MDGRKEISVPAATLEAFSTGDADFLESKLFDVLYKASEAVSRDGHEYVEVVVRIIK